MRVTLFLPVLFFTFFFSNQTHAQFLDPNGAESKVVAELIENLNEVCTERLNDMETRTLIENRTNLKRYLVKIRKGDASAGRYIASMQRFNNNLSSILLKAGTNVVNGTLTVVCKPAMTAHRILSRFLGL